MKTFKPARTVQLLAFSSILANGYAAPSAFCADSPTVPANAPSVSVTDKPSPAAASTTASSTSTTAPADPKNALGSTADAKATSPAAPAGPDKVTECMAYKSEHQAAPTKKHKKRPVRFVAKALASEFKTEGEGMLQDTAFVFSAKDFDPYAGKPPENKPYTVLELELVDGSSASIVRYPDNSCKIVGSFLDNTIVCPDSSDTFIVAYPNGARSKMVRVSSSEYKMYRPDKTITTLTLASSGEWEINNSKLGYLGTAQPDRENLQFEMHTKDY